METRARQYWLLAWGCRKGRACMHQGVCAKAVWVYVHAHCCVHVHVLIHPRTTSRLLPHSKYVCLQFHSQYMCSHAHPQQALFHLPPQDFNTALASLSPAEAELVQSWARADIARKHTWVNIGDDKAVRHGERTWQTCS